MVTDSHSFPEDDDQLLITTSIAVLLLWFVDSQHNKDYNYLADDSEAFVSCSRRLALTLTSQATSVHAATNWNGRCSSGPHCHSCCRFFPACFASLPSCCQPRAAFIVAPCIIAAFIVPMYFLLLLRLLKSRFCHFSSSETC